MPRSPRWTKMAQKGRSAAVTSLKESLTKRFGASLQEVVEAEVESRVAGKSRLDREDLDAIEESILAARRRLRGTDGTLRGKHTRSAPTLPALPSEAPAPTQSQPLARAATAVSVRSAAPVVLVPPRPARMKPPRRIPPAPYGGSIVDEEDSGKVKKGQQVGARYPIPLPPKIKPMDHWDLMVAFDSVQHQKEYEAFIKAGKYEQIEKFKRRLDTQLEEQQAIKDAEAEEQRKADEAFRAKLEENKRLTRVEQEAEHAKQMWVKNAADEMNKELEQRRQRALDKKENMHRMMTAWLASEKQKQLEERIEKAHEHARLAEKAREDMAAQLEEKRRRKEAKDAEEKAFAAEAIRVMDARAAAEAAAVQKRVDKMESNLASIGKEIAERDAKAERELEERIRRVQEEADRAAKEDADRRAADRKQKVQAMLRNLDGQMIEKEQRRLEEIAEDKKQLEIFKQQLEESEKIERAKQDKFRKAREAMDVALIDKIRHDLSVHPRSFGSELSRVQEVAINRKSIERIAAANFCPELANHLLAQATHKGKLIAFPSVGRYEGPIDELELQVPEI